MKKALKLEGYTGDVTNLPWGRFQIFYQYMCPAASKAATLITHDGPHEPMYTASEVRAILDELRDAAGHDAIDSAMIEAGIPSTPDADVMGLDVPKADHA